LEEGLGTHKVERISDMEKIDVLVIGAGVVGLAIARTMAKEGRQVIVAEAEKLPGSITTSRNSGVIHAGIYYRQGSMKAQLCVRGKTLLYEYAKERTVPYRNCGKLIVACSEEEVGKLEDIRTKAARNNVDDLEILSIEETKEMERNVVCKGALLSPSTGIIDVHTLVEEFIKDIENADGLIAYDNSIEKIEIQCGTFLVHVRGGGLVKADMVINAAGINAQNVARTISGLDPASIPKQYLAKGHYFGISGKSPFNRLIYPVPVKGGLGTHFTMNMAGESIFGPDVLWLKDGEVIEYNVDESRSEKFYEAIKRYWPEIGGRKLRPAYAGVRPKVVGPNEPDGDFIIQMEEDHGVPNLVNLYGIESPGLTASMAIAEMVAGRLHN